MITRNYFKIVRVFPDPDDYFYIKNESYDTGDVIVGNASYDWPSDINLQYSTDKTNWTNCVADTYISLQGGEKVYFRNDSGTFSVLETSDVSINMSVNFSAGGNLATLLDYTNKDGILSIPNGAFNYLFFNRQYGGYLINIDNLSLGNITTAGSNSLKNMFYQQSYLERGLDLSQITSVGENFNYSMYELCSSLNEVYAPSISSWNNLNGCHWLNNVAQTGVVYKPANLVINTNTGSGVPSGWTTQTYPQA